MGVPRHDHSPASHPTPNPSPSRGGESLRRTDAVQSARLPSGGLIDRGRSVAFSFDGRSYRGHPGDTLASALLGNGVHLVGRSFKYHRPRGILTAGPEEPNALVELRAGARREPNTRATTAELYDGLVAASQNRWPSLRFDLMAVNSLIAPVLSAGFYYKTFMWPASFWEKVYEPLIRRAAGLGRASAQEDPDTYEKAFLHCDVLVVGGGPAGLMAALAAGQDRCARRAVRRGLSSGRAADCREPRLGRSKLGRVGGPYPSRIGGAAQCAHHAPHDGGGRLRRRHLLGAGARQRPRRRAARARAAPTPVAHLRQALRARRRGHRAAAGVRRQRPSRHHAGRRRARLSQPLRRRSRAACGGVRHQRRDGTDDCRPQSGRRARRSRRRSARERPRQHRSRGQVRRCAADRRRRHHAGHRIAARARCRHQDRVGRDGARSLAISFAFPAAGARPCI